MTTRMDHLRNLVAAIGDKQTDYLQFFPAFATRLESELGDFLGSRESVALCCAYESFNFDQGSYHHTGLGFENGKYRIPFMFRLKHLEDDGDFLVRVRLYFTREGTNLSVQIEGDNSLPLSETDLTPLCEYVYQHLCNIFSETTWFEQNKPDYKGTGIGFTYQEPK
ncbi:MAG: hypothetical protein ACRCU9_11070 [Iodobacter sp.]